MKKSSIRYISSFVVMGIILAILVLVNICVGSTQMSLGEIWPALLSGDEGNTARTILMNIRLPRIFTALLLGGALSVSGFLLQIFFGNPIAGPYVLGISSGAKLTVALTMVFLMGQGVYITSGGMILAAFIGSLLSMGVVLALSSRVRNMSMLVVCGVMIGYICSAITDLVVTFADDSNIVNLHNWSLGSFSGMSWSNVTWTAVLVTIGVLASFFMSKSLGAYQMGETYARSMGVNIGLVRVLLILISSLLSATVTAIAGPISFVGIAVPHLVRGLTRTAKPIVMIPACFLGGSIVTLLCDGIARCMFAPTEVSISSVTAVLLVPVVLYLMIRRNK